MLPNADLVDWVGRAALVILFPVSAVDKLMHWKDAVRQAESSILPGGRLLLVPAILIEVAAPLMVLAYWHDRPAALVLAAYCVATALLYHRFWKFPDFWSKNGEGRAHFWDFLKNFGLTGGLLLAALHGFLG